MLVPWIEFEWSLPLTEATIEPERRSGLSNRGGVMVSALRTLILVLCVASFVAPVCAQEIDNWPAPLLWSAGQAEMAVDEGKAPAGLKKEGLQALPPASSPR